MSDDRELGTSRSWFAVFNNPAEHGYDGESTHVCERLKEEWIAENPTRTGAWLYCVSAEGLHHVHMVLEDSKPMRFTAIKNSYAIGMHFEPTKGNKEQAEDYINKRGKWEEKGEVILYSTKHGEIKGAKGNRRDLEVIDELLSQGLNPQQIMDYSLSYRKYEKMIKDAYFRKRTRETPRIRDVKVVWHVGEAGSGKSQYCFNELAELYSDDNVFAVTDYEGGGFDMYCGQPILILDEFKGQIKWATLLNVLDKYRVQIHARYANCTALWNEVHITSVFPPELCYTNMVSLHQEVDTYAQLKRRITTITYHYKDEKGQFKKLELPSAEYINYDDLKNRIHGGFVSLVDDSENPFNQSTMFD